MPQWRTMIANDQPEQTYWAIKMGDEWWDFWKDAWGPFTLQCLFEGEWVDANETAWSVTRETEGNILTELHRITMDFQCDSKRGK